VGLQVGATNVLHAAECSNWASQCFLGNRSTIQSRIPKQIESEGAQRHQGDRKMQRECWPYGRLSVVPNIKPVCAFAKMLSACARINCGALNKSMVNINNNFFACIDSEYLFFTQCVYMVCFNPTVYPNILFCPVCTCFLRNVWARRYEVWSRTQKRNWCKGAIACWHDRESNQNAT